MNIAIALWVLGILILIAIIAAILLARVIHATQHMTPTKGNPWYIYNRTLFRILRGDPEDSHAAVGIGFAPRLIGYEAARYDAVVTKVAYFFGLRFVYVES